ncbi:MAG: OmpA family protein [Rhodobacteraceae bacterium]|nr:OmpA family protein [Paracoccaceae bacterium]
MAILRKSTALVLVAGLGLAACTNPDGTTNNTGTGALLGGGLGAAIGAAVAGDNTRGAVIGGLIGAGIGGAIGDDLDRQEAALRQQMGGSGVSIVNTGSQLIVTLPEAITFPVDSARLKPGFVQSLRALSANIQQYPNTTIEVVGHTDSTGQAAYNQGLSERRAISVRSVLVNNGVSGNRIRAYGLGENQPVASNATANGRQQNRRVEIFITPNR